MIESFTNLEEFIINKLKESNLIERFSFNEIQQTPDLELILKLFNEPVEIFHDREGLYFQSENGDKIYCPKMLTSISEKGEWISDKLPNVCFDIEQSGNVRKADEAEALFCLINVSMILKEDSFKEEVRNFASSYDFNNMKPISDEEKTFRNLLNDWQELQSSIINILISACKYRLSDFKKDSEKFLKDGISELEVIELRDLQAKIRAINFKYSEGVLSPLKIKELTKISKLQLIFERDEEISILITKSKAGILYKLLNLSSEYISPVSKKKISIWVRSEVDKALVSDKSFKIFSEERTQIIAKIQRRALRFEKNSVRRLNIEKYIEDRENFRLPSKL